MDESLEDRAVHIAAYSRRRWKDLDEATKEHYRRLAEQERVVQHARKELGLGSYEPTLTFPPLKL
jgi:hypothetical protein